MACPNNLAPSGLRAHGFVSASDPLYLTCLMRLFKGEYVNHFFLLLQSSSGTVLDHMTRLLQRGHDLNKAGDQAGIDSRVLKIEFTFIPLMPWMFSAGDQQQPRHTSLGCVEDHRHSDQLKLTSCDFTVPAKIQTNKQKYYIYSICLQGFQICRQL